MWTGMRAAALAMVMAMACAALPLAAAGQSVAPDQEQKLIAVLGTSTDLHEKARACQQLAAIGDKAAVPALATLLGDEQMAAYARSGLEAIADPSASDALRKAMGTLHGRLLAGVVASLGMRGDAKAVGAIARLVNQPDLDLAGAALTSLAQIGTPDAMKVVQSALSGRSQDLHPLAAQALLLAGDRLLARGKSAEAAALFQRVRTAAVPKYTQLAALQRVIVAKGPAGSSLLEEQLGSSDPAARAMALRVTRQMPGAEVTHALANQLARAQPATQALLVQALLDRTGPDVLPAIEAAASTGAPEVRVAALTALGQIGSASSVPVLLKALDGGAEAQAAAVDSLARLPGKDGETAIVAALPDAKPAAQIRLVGVLATRGVWSAADPILKLAAGPDADVAKASLKAMSVLARAGDEAELVRLAAAAKDDSVRDAAGRAALAASAKNPDIGGRSAPVAAALASASDPAVKGAMLGLLAEIGTWPAYATAKGALNDPDAKVKAAAVQALADWPDAMPAAVLLGVAKAAPDATTRSVALRGAVRMASTLASECARPSPQTADWLKQANDLVRGDADEKRLILSAAANLKSAAGLALVQPYLADAAVQSEAALAAIQIAKQMPDDQRPMAKPLIEKALAAATSDTVRSQADEALKQIPGPGAELRVPDPPTGEIDVSKLTFRPLFDGRTFEGWEGDTANAFRIEDGAVVGGSLKAALKQNEFLCTTRSFGNFVLRAECKLTGLANGGIQIRSQRVPASSEVCGYQPDMDSSGQYWGCLYDESRRGMLVQADVSKTKQVVKPDDWNQYEIRCEGPRIRLYVNGLLTVDYTEKDPEIPLAGIIGLQIHQGNPSETRYRNIRIAELP